MKGIQQIAQFKNIKLNDKFKTKFNTFINTFN